MKSRGYKVELVTEFAKDLVYQESYFRLKDQLMIFARQNHKLWVLKDKVDYAIVDSPLLFETSRKDNLASFLIFFITSPTFNSTINF